MSCTVLAMVIAAGNESRRWTWSLIPPMANAIYAHSFGGNLSETSGLRSCVANT